METVTIGETANKLPPSPLLCALYGTTPITLEQSLAPRATTASYPAIDFGSCTALIMIS